MTHDTLAYHLFMMRTDGAEGYGWTLFFFKSFCTLACLGYCCCCMAIQPFQAVLLQVCVCVWVSVYALLREWGPDAQHCHSGSVHTGYPRRKPWHLPLEMTTPLTPLTPPPPPPVLWSHSAGQGNRAVWEEVERKQQRGIRARSRSDQKKWKQGIINWERGQWEFYTKIRFTLEQTSWQLVRARYLRKNKQFCFINDSFNWIWIWSGSLECRLEFSF